MVTLDTLQVSFLLEKLFDALLELIIALTERIYLISEFYRHDTPRSLLNHSKLIVLVHDHLSHSFDDLVALTYVGGRPRHISVLRILALAFVCQQAINRQRLLLQSFFQVSVLVRDDLTVLTFIILGFLG